MNVITSSTLKPITISPIDRALHRAEFVAYEYYHEAADTIDAVCNHTQEDLQILLNHIDQRLYDLTHQ